MKKYMMNSPVIDGIITGIAIVFALLLAMPIVCRLALWWWQLWGVVP